MNEEPSLYEEVWIDFNAFFLFNRWWIALDDFFIVLRYNKTHKTSSIYDSSFAYQSLPTLFVKMFKPNFLLKGFLTSLHMHFW